MRKTASILIVIIILIIVGCSNKEVTNYNYTFKGENELWTAEYKANDTVTFTTNNGVLDAGSESSNILTVKYKKDISKLYSIKHLEISYESSASSGEIKTDFKNDHPTQNTYTLQSGGTGALIEDKDEIIKVNINIDGKIQTIELKNVK